MTEVWIVMQNDFPVSVFTTEAAAKAWAHEQTYNGATKYLHIQGPYSVDTGVASGLCRA